jgi:hypothetical protein
LIAPRLRFDKLESILAEALINHWGRERFPIRAIGRIKLQEQLVAIGKSRLDP